MKKVILVVGTRPEAIKMAPIYRAMKRSAHIEPFLLSTGQHREMLV
ncbi:MAG: UDP-N-acetylglucosamine 2-epimerase (non-hydrolyzing), partial [bacterium]